MDDALSEALSKLNWVILEKVHSMLAPFMELQGVLEGGKCVSGSLVIILIRLLSVNPPRRACC